MTVPMRWSNCDQTLGQPIQTCPSNYKAMASDPRRTTSPDRASRSSFSSIREQESELAQAFTKSKVSSYSSNEDATEEPVSSIFDTKDSNGMAVVHFLPPKTQPYSKLRGFWAPTHPADNFKGWKQINVNGKLASKSSSDLQSLSSVWSTEVKPKKKGKHAPGDAPFEKLPMELLRSIIDLLVLDIPPNGTEKRNVDLMSLMVTSRTIHSATLGSLYHRITIPRSNIFRKFLAHIKQHPILGEIVRRLDFCHFNQLQLFETAAERSEARNLTEETLLLCLELTPYLQEFLAQEYIEDDLGPAVLRKLFLGLPRLQAVDFCGCSSAAFRNAFSAIVKSDWPVELSIRRLSLHKCLTLPSSILEALLPRLPRLTHLDLAGTRITDTALASIPASAKITHLNLARCSLLSARGVMDFLAQHKSVSTRLTFLSLATDARSHQLLDAEDVRELLPVLPRTLRSLSLKGSKMDASHIELLRPLTKHLEELAIGRGLRLEDTDRFFVPDENEDDMTAQLNWVPHTLKYMDLSDLFGTNELEMSYLYGSKCPVLKTFSEPLEVVELAEEVFRRLSKSPVPIERAGWRLSECDSRGWIVRNPRENGKRADGRRSWKMGAESWGMRKIPVARADVGGMYGSFMFGRKL